MLCVAYETLARRGELVALELHDIEFWPNGKPVRPSQLTVSGSDPSARNTLTVTTTDALAKPKPIIQRKTAILPLLT